MKDKRKKNSREKKERQKDRKKTRKKERKKERRKKESVVVWTDLRCLIMPTVNRET